MANITDVKLPDSSQYDLKDNVSGYASKVSSPITDDLAKLTATGDLADSGKKLSDLVLKSDVKDVLNSTSTTDPLSANQGRLIADNITANENVYGAKNLLPYPWVETTKTANGLTFTDNGDGTLTLGTGTASADTYFEFCRRYDYTVFLQNGTYLCTGCPSGVPVGVSMGYANTDSMNFYYDTGNGVEMPINGTALGNTGSYIGASVEVKNGTVISTPITFKPMLRDARILDDTFVPFAETNLQLTKKTSGLSNENLLDNPFFTVNQRGATTITSGYGADRWKTTGGSVTFGSGGVTFSGTSAQIDQPLESILPNGTYTASVLLSDGTIISGTATKTSDSVNTIFYNTASLLLVYRYNTQAFALYSASAKTIRAVKLELGSVSTLANDVEPNYTTELLKCQRYFQRISALAGYAILATGVMDDATTLWGQIPLTVPLRATPTVSTAGTFNIRHGGALQNISSITLDLRSPTMLSFFVTSSTNLTAGTPAQLLFNTTSTYIDLSADL